MGSNPVKLFPREIFDEHLKRFGKFGLAMAIMVLPFFTSKVEDAPDMDGLAKKFKEASDNGTALDNDSVNATSLKENEAYNNRMKDVFEDIFRLKYI